MSRHRAAFAPRRTATLAVAWLLAWAQLVLPAAHAVHLAVEHSARPAAEYDLGTMVDARLGSHGCGHDHSVPHLDHPQARPSGATPIVPHSHPSEGSPAEGCEVCQTIQHPRVPLFYPATPVARLAVPRAFAFAPTFTNLPVRDVYFVADPCRAPPTSSL